MKLERYELKAEKSLMVFEFVSEGPKPPSSQRYMRLPTSTRTRGFMLPAVRDQEPDYTEWD
jgi:hypothetical protein